jgi:hypothetical protein
MKIETCKLCNECGFLRGGIKGTLKPELGLFDIIENQILFPCHLQLKAVTGSENQGVEIYAEETNTFKVCYGYVASLHKSRVIPKHPVMRSLMKSLDTESDDYKRVMTIEETLKYHEIDKEEV